MPKTPLVTVYPTNLLKSDFAVVTLDSEVLLWDVDQALPDQSLGSDAVPRCLGRRSDASTRPVEERPTCFHSGCWT